LAKKLFIKNYGCQMNVYDSARMADILAPLGYAPTQSAADADLIILNTCHIREKAAEKVYSDLGRLKRLKTRRPGGVDDGVGDGADHGADHGARGARGALIAVAGCVAQAEGEEILRRAPYVDMVFGPQTYHRLPEMVARAARAADSGTAPGGGGGILDTEFPPEAKFDFLPEAVARGPSAFLTVQEGCDKFCAFCVVPYTRGAEYSRPESAVVAEARALAAQGVREITLLGQNVNAYHGCDDGLAGLIRTLAEIDGLERIRYTTSHPGDMDESLIEAHGEVPQLMPHLHLAVQTGSDRVLARMGRRHVVSDYLGIVDALRRVRPDIALSTDFIVGHPGETEEDFEATMALVRRVGYAQAYSFKYSRRPGTPAAAMEDQVPEQVKSDRLKRLQALLDEQQQGFNRASVGAVVPVLFDRHGRGGRNGRSGRNGRQLAGRSPHMQAVYVDCPDAAFAEQLFGTVANVRLTAAHANSLAGQIDPGAGASAPPRIALESASA
jgi:tRNA-2-methylthio-N6-dimethylallyladenosine synthase